MNPRILLLLVVLLAAGSWGLFTLATRPAAPPPLVSQPPAGPSAERTGILRRSPEAASEILIHRTETSDVVRLIPQMSGLWELTEPILDRAEPALLLQLFTVLQHGQAEPLEPVWEARTDAELGLAEPQLVLEMAFPEEGVHRLEIGARHSNGNQCFALLNGERRMVPRMLADLLGRPVAQWRDHAVLRHPRQVVALRWTPPSGPGFHVVRSGNGWELREPIQGRVDLRRVRALERLIGIRASSLPSDVAPAALRQEIEAVAGELQVDSLLQGSARDTQTLLFHNEVVIDRDRAYYMPVYPDDRAVLDLPAEELRSRKLLHFDPSHISSLRLTRPSGTVELRRTGLGWVGEDGSPLASAQQKRLTQLLVELGNLEAQDEATRPAGIPARQLLLSIAAQPVERGATQLRWWPLAEGSAVANTESAQVFASTLALDAAWAEILDHP